MVSEGAPYRFTDTRNRGSAKPLTLRVTGSPSRSAEPDSHVYGAMKSTFPERPQKSSDRAKPSTAELVFRSGLVTGNAGSNDRPPCV